MQKAARKRRHCHLKGREELDQAVLSWPFEMTAVGRWCGPSVVKPEVDEFRGREFGRPRSDGQADSAFSAVNEIGRRG